MIHRDRFFEGFIVLSLLTYGLLAVFWSDVVNSEILFCVTFIWVSFIVNPLLFLVATYVVLNDWHRKLRGFAPIDYEAIGLEVHRDCGICN